jgi:hypothetical protein
MKINSSLSLQAQYSSILERSHFLIGLRGEWLRDVGSENLISYDILKGGLILQLHASETLEPLWRVHQIQAFETTFDEMYEDLEEALKEFDARWIIEKPASLLQTIQNAIEELLEGGEIKFSEPETMESVKFVENLLIDLNCKHQVQKDADDVIIKILG